MTTPSEHPRPHRGTRRAGRTDGLARLRRAPGPLLAVAFLASCGDGPDVAGALGGDTGLVTKCTPVEGTAPVVFADETLRNESPRPLTIDEIRLAQPDGLRLSDAFLLPVQDQTLLGTVPLPPSSPAWQERRPAVGAELAPGETWNLALTLDRDSDEQPGRFADVEVDYTTGGDSSTHRLRYALTVVAAPACATARG